MMLTQLTFPTEFSRKAAILEKWYGIITGVKWIRTWTGFELKQRSVILRWTKIEAQTLAQLTELSSISAERAKMGSWTLRNDFELKREHSNSWWAQVRLWEYDWLWMTDSETIGLDLSEKWAHFWRNDPILAGMVRNGNGLLTVSSDELGMIDILNVLNWPVSFVDSDWLGSGMT